MGFFQKIIDDFGLGQHKVDEEALYAQIALFKDDLKAQEGKYTNQDEAIQFRDKWADLYKEAKAARLGKKSPLWEDRKQFTDTFDRLAEVLTGYNSAVIALNRNGVMPYFPTLTAKISTHSNGQLSSAMRKGCWS